MTTNDNELPNLPYALDFGYHGNERTFLLASLAAVVTKYAGGKATLTLDEAEVLPCTGEVDVKCDGDTMVFIAATK
jgi:hypothetical protein